MCLTPIAIPFLSGKQKIFPCGHCADCLRHNANELVVRTIRESEKYGIVSFVTFTYDDNNIPFQLTKVVNDTVQSCVIKSTDFRYWRYLDEWKHQSGKVVYNKNGEACLCRFPISRKDKLGNDVYVYPTVYSRDVQLWLKNARIKYERKYGHKLPEFKYLCVPEYGSVTYRPHYHFMFFGLERDQVAEITSSWKYGNVDIKMLSGYGRDISGVSRYVAKYATKGSLDCPYITKTDVRPSLCVKPRRFSSIGFGIGDADEFNRMKDYYLCKDVFGDYSIENLSDFTTEQLSTLVDTILSRKYYNINGYKYPLPKYLKQKIYYIKEKVKVDYDWKRDDYVFEVKTRASKLQSLVAQTVVKHLHRDSVAKQDQMRRLCKLIGKSFYKMQMVKEDALQYQAEIAEKKLYNELTRSLF